MKQQVEYLLDHFREEVQQHPASIAIEDGTKSLDESAWPKVSYAELDALSDAWSRQLAVAGVGPGCIVPLISTRSIAMVAAVLAILKLRAAYVPIDADSWGKDRINGVLARISPQIVVSTAGCLGGGHPYPVHYFEEPGIPNLAMGNDISTPSHYLRSCYSGDDLAYIIFTSGTTGQPKGVMVGLESISRYVNEGGDLPFNFNTRHGTRVLLICSIAFDGVVFSTICNGGTLILADPPTLEAAAKTCHVLPLTPSILSSLDPDAGFDRVEKIFLGGEAPAEPLIQAWCSPQRRLYNSYGPTETTCTVLMSELVAGLPITIGYPIPYSTVSLLDAEGLESSEGEICISGSGLALGYFRDPERTASSFVKLNGQKLYRTGDYGKHTKNGIQFCGRRDSMAKNRGFLINLESDVEPALLSFEKVTRAAACMANGKLIAFVTPVEARDGLREYLSANIPSFMVPDIVYSMDTFPTTVNGKINRQSLVQIHEASQDTDDSFLEVRLSGTEAIRRAISYVLQQPMDQVTNASSFRHLGGNSLAAVLLASILRKAGFAISVGQILLLDIVDKMAGALKEAENAVKSPPTSGQFGHCLGEAISGANFPGSEALASMTDIQTRMVRASIATPGLSFIKASFTLEHPGRDDFTATLRAAWESIHKRHGILRTHFVLTEPEVQVIYRDAKIAWTERTIAETDWDTACRQEEDFDFSQFSKFDPGERCSLSKITIVTIPGIRTRFIWTVHHSLIYGWSMSTLIKEMAFYLNNKPLPPDPPQFKHVAVSIDQLRRKYSSKAISFWKAYTEGYVPVQTLRLPPPSDINDYKQATLTQNLTISVSALEKAARDQYSVTPATLLYAAWGILISRYTGTDRTILGAVLSGRNLEIPGVQNVIGPLINTLPLKVDANESQTAYVFVRGVFRALCEILQYQWSPFTVIQEGSGYNPAKLFDTIFALQYDFPQMKDMFSRDSLPRDVRYTEATEIPLTVLLDSDDSRFIARFIYRRSYFSDTTIIQMCRHFDNLLTGLVDALPAANISTVTRTMFSAPEYQALTAKALPPNYLSLGESLSDAIEKAIECYPNLCAVEGLSRSLSYHEFGRVTANIAEQLRKSVKLGDVVCVICDGSITWLIAMIAVIRAGAVYCPIDQKLPQARMEYMVENSSASLIIHCNAKQDLVINDTPCFNIIKAMAEIAYTTTKCIPLKHKGILNVISHEKGRLCSTPGQRNAQMLSLGFDCCIKEVFATLCFGATLVLKDPANPIAHLSRVDATMATASLLTSLEPGDFPSLAVIMAAGEVLSQSLADKWATGRTLINGYAPAESTLIATVATISPGDKVSIGRPLTGMSCYILDSKQRPAPIGVSGEICLAGIQITSGYLSNEGETAKRFLQDPFNPDQAMFRTGDIGRLGDDGNINFVGREDNQIKLRGFRIDLGEVQNTLSQVATEAKDVALVVSNDTLVAFVTPETLDIDQLVKGLESQLPEYAIPSQIITLATLPTSANHKVNALALKQLINHTAPTASLVELETPIQRTIAEIWADVLGHELGKMPISPNSRFFELGGHSLLQIRVAQAISKQCNIHPMPLRQVIYHQSLRELSLAVKKLIDSQEKQERVTRFLETSPLVRENQLPLSPLEQELFLNHLISDGSTAGNMIFACKILGQIDPVSLARAFQQTAMNEEIFQARYHVADGFMMRHLVKDRSNIVRVTNTHDPMSLIHKTARKSFDLSTGPPLEVVIIPCTTVKAILLIVMSHVVGDATTMATYLEQASDRYKQLQTPNASDIHFRTPKELTYIDWAGWVKIPQLSLQSQNFWTKYLSKLPEPLTFGRAPAGSLTYTGSLRSWTLPGSMLQSLTRLATRSSTTMHQIVIAALFLALQCVDRRNDIIFAAPFTHRMEPGTETMAGLFLDRLPIRIQCGPNEVESLLHFLTAVKQSSQRALEHVLPYREIRKLLPYKPSLSDPLFKVMVTYHTASDMKPAFRLEGAEIQNIPCHNTGGSKFPLSIELTEIEDSEVRVDIEYDLGCIAENTAERIQYAIGYTLQLMVLDTAPNRIKHLVISSFGDFDRYKPSDSTDGREEEKRGRRDNETTLQHQNTNGLERLVTGIRDAMCQCLGLDNKAVLLHQSFWELGAQSIDAIQLQHICSKHGFGIRLRDIFESNDIMELAICTYGSI
ncbi:nonribosomal peptide synthase GliP [Trichophyton benhamiae CBS 112371]|uniref:Nonribosomal peptide synthase GliP n=1 Tax=Arthroderma benhamiae (strain ATCC MYA-4681 / CBS 112371) TaxID=663331 RepID=D4AUE6_ARTBC|nr:nonribosomal peptide synthase GliP [Trichophyton benhamiae CBS 112371]EFE33111.1 nonribosomal peptide synthase GliP [Trichophyton benhamiae CBS 112371]